MNCLIRIRRASQANPGMKPPLSSKAASVAASAASQRSKSGKFHMPCPGLGRIAQTDMPSVIIRALKLSTLLPCSASSSDGCSNRKGWACTCPQKHHRDDPGTRRLRGQLLPWHGHACARNVSGGPQQSRAPSDSLLVCLKQCPSLQCTTSRRRHLLFPGSS